MPERQPIIVHRGEKRNPLGVLISGKRYVGKTTFAGLLQAESTDQGLAAATYSTSLGNKAAFCEANDLDLEQFLHDRDYKETYRQAFSAYVLTISQEENLAAFLKATESDLGLMQVMIISDIRNRFDLEGLCWVYPAFLTLRVTATDETRKARGYSPSTYDQSAFETELDGIPMTHEISNDGPLEELRGKAESLAETLADFSSSG